METIQIDQNPLQGGDDKRGSLVTDINVRKKRKSFALVLTDMTHVAHIFILFFTGLIVYLCLTVDEFAFFTWHPLLLSIGWMLLMSEGVIFLTTVPDKKVERSTKLNVHFIVEGVAFSLSFIGFWIAYLNKDNLNKQHFKSWHGIFGLIAVIFSVPTALDGIAAKYSLDLKQFMTPKYVKLIHVICGVLTLIFGGVCLVLSVYTRWFERQTGHNLSIFYIALFSVLMAVIFAIIKPFFSCIFRLQNIFTTRS